MSEREYKISFDAFVREDACSKFVDEYLNREITKACDEALRSYDIKRKLIPEIVKNMVYAHKDEIVEQITDRAVRELCKKALPKLLERVASDA